MAQCSMHIVRRSLVPIQVKMYADTQSWDELTERYHARYAFMDLRRASSMELDEVVSFAIREGIVVMMNIGRRVSSIRVEE